MVKRILIIPILLIVIFSYNIKALLIQYQIPLSLKPIGELSEIEMKLLDAKFNIFKPREIPDWVYEMKPGPERILNVEDGFELINVSNAPSAQSETWIAINPANPLNLIATANDTRYMSSNPGYRMVAWYSTDGGKTWSESTTPKNQGLYINLPANPNDATIFDPGITFDSRGWAYYSYGFAILKDGETGDNGVFISRSTDGGKTWEIPTYAALGGNVGDGSFHDRYLITADSDPNSPYKNNVYVTWQRFQKNPGICFSRLAPGEEIWTIPLLIGGDNGSQSPQPVIGPDGVIYVAYIGRTINNQTEALFQKSTNGGTTWLPSPKLAQKVYSTGSDFQGRDALIDKQNLRVSSYPAIAVDNSKGPRRGWVYVVQSGKDASGKNALYLSRSTDGGNNWTSNIRIDNNELRNDIFFPAIYVDAKTGMVTVLYYSSQNDPENKGVDAYLAVSTDGINFINIRITPKTWYLNNQASVSVQGSTNLGIYWGDYTSIVAYDGKIYPLFWMPTTSNANFYSLDLFTALISGAPKPPENLQITSSYSNPTQATLKWTDPTINIIGFELSDFKIEIYRENSKIASVEKGVQQYVDEGLTNGLLYNYYIKAVSSTGESTPVSASVYAGGNPKPLPPTNLVAKPAETGIILSWINPATHIDGTSFEDFDKINIYIDGKLKQTYSDNLQSGETSSTLVELPTRHFYKIKITALSKRNETLITESEPSTEEFSYSGLPYNNLKENFDDEDNLMPYYTQSDWGLTQVKYVTPPNALTDTPSGKYKNSDTTFVILAPIKVSGEDTTFSFETIALLENNDWGFVEISNDFCKSWTVLLMLDKRYSDKFGDSISTSDWETVSRSLIPFIGDTIYIRFRIASNVLKNADGWYIDNLRFDNSYVNSTEEVYSEKYKFEGEIYPNPSTGNSTLKINYYKSGNTYISLYDNLGNEVIKIANKFSEVGSDKFQLSLSTLISGIYYCRITHTGGTITIPLILHK